MNAQPVIDLLKAGLTGFTTVAGAADLDAVLDAGMANPPAVWVMPLAETGDEPYLAGVYAQRTQQSFGVVLVVQNLRGQVGEGNISELAAKRSQIKQALCGKELGGEIIVFASGRALKFASGQFWWLDEFRLVQDYRN